MDYEKDSAFKIALFGAFYREDVGDTRYSGSDSSPKNY